MGINKNNKELRQYDKNSSQFIFYKAQHEIQTYDYVCSKLNQYKLDNTTMTIIQALNLMDDFVDPSDPDLDLPNSVHAYQTAERIRKKYPLNYELQITGLIHDLGKVLYKWGEESYSVVGDTFVVGAKFPESIVFYETIINNPDFNNPNYNTKNGIYEENCGLDNVKIAFGHDEYLYLVLSKNKNHKLTKKYWNIIRYHSLYPWHSEEEYKHLMNPNDEQTLTDVKYFNQFDLYSKEDDDFVLTEEIKEYYKKILIDYFPEPLQW
jgi:inositol oxygenase